MAKEYDECGYCKKCKIMKYRVTDIDGCYLDFCTIKCATAYLVENTDEFIERLDYK